MNARLTRRAQRPYSTKRARMSATRRKEPRRSAFRSAIFSTVFAQFATARLK